MSSQEISNKLWNLCNTLRDDGVTYHQYLNELTFILFLKLSEVKGYAEDFPPHYRWEKFVDQVDNLKAFQLYKEFLVKVSSETKSDSVKEIYTNASTTITKAVNFKTIISAIDKLDWYEEHDRDVMGDIYESLLQKNANEKKSGAGQYFTPRPLINVMVKLMAPKLGERWNDPACGTFGFMISVNQYLIERYDYMYSQNTKSRDFQVNDALSGVELVTDAHRLALMNARLHGLESRITLGDTLTDLGKSLPPMDGILANPPFGTKKGGERPTRDDFTFPTSNKQLNFLQHIYRGLKKNGKAHAAVILPDNVLFEDGDGQKIRRDLMDKCNLHTILRLPTGIFYAAGVKTNVLFFTRGKKDEGNTDNVWYYDMRTNMPNFGVRTPFTEAAFDGFIRAYTGGLEPEALLKTYDGEVDNAKRKKIKDERWQCISKETIAAKNYSLDMGLIADDSITQASDMGTPYDIAMEAKAELHEMMKALDNLIKELK